MSYPNSPNVPPQRGYPPQQGYPQDPRRVYRRRRHISRFQVRIGSLGLIACVAGIYLFATGRAVNIGAALLLILGGGLVFALCILLPLLLRR